MNILLINYEYPPVGGGAATATQNIGRHLVEQGHQVTVLTSQFSDLTGWSDEQGICVLRCNAIRKRKDASNLTEMMSFVASAALALPGLIKRRDIEGAIIFFSFPCGPLGILVKLLANIPYVISLRGGDVPGAEPELNWLHKLLKPLRRLVFRHSRAIVANSYGLKDMSESADRFPVKVIFNGVDVDDFHPLTGKASKQNRPFMFLFVGRFRPQKNLFFLIKNLDLLRTQTKTLFKIHIVGEGPLKDSIIKYAQTTSIYKDIVWHGWLDKANLKFLYQEADCLLLPSLYEGMPNVALEAMACGVPVIASRVAGNTDVIENEKTGGLFELADSQGFLKYLKMVTENRHVVEAWGNLARLKACRDFSWAETARRYIDLFH